MAIDFQKTFGANSNEGANTTGTKANQPKAQLWLNIGYDSGVVDENTGETKFVSLPVGIPLDTQEHLPTNARNQDYAQFMAARNDLLDQIMAAAGDLAPGEATVLNLQIQLRRVAEERQNVVADADSKFVAQRPKLVA